MSLVLNVEILGEFKKLTQATTGAQKSLTNMEKGVSKVSSKINGLLGAIGVSFSINAVIKGVKDLTASASDLAESQNALNVAFGESSKGLAAFGKAAATNLGLAEKDFNQIATQFSSFAKTIVGNGGDATVVIKDLATRGADFASVFNLEVSDALGKFQSGLAGQSEPLRQFGIDLSAAAVESYALANGIGDGEGALTEAEKVLARYGLLMQQTEMTAGDFKNTSNGLANTQRILNAEFENAKAEIGAALLPIMVELFQEIRDNMPAIKQMITGFVDFARFVGGLTLEFIKNKDTLIPLVATFGGLLISIKTITVAMTAYRTIAATIAAINAGIAASNTAIAATAGTATAATTALTVALRAAAAAAAIIGVLSLSGSAPQAGTVPSATKPVDDGERTNIAPPQKQTGIPGITAPVIPKSPTTGSNKAPVTINNNVTVKKSTASAQDIAKAVNREIKTVGTNVIRAI